MAMSVSGNCVWSHLNWDQCIFAAPSATRQNSWMNKQTNK